jgi:hypothetical protein
VVKSGSAAVCPETDKGCVFSVAAGVEVGTSTPAADKSPEQPAIAKLNGNAAITTRDKPAMVNPRRK